ncbi:MAG TPA: hypothetical protein VGZ29_14265 [Terriglobia bacterium]|nr:hypothetical protein [Terriglobia bacterium]
MRELAVVGEAKELMNEARDWSVWRWLLEKKRVRLAADRANEALDNLAKEVRASWEDDLQKVYRELEAQDSCESNPRTKRQYEKAKAEARHVDAKIRLAVERVKQADDEAWNVRLDAEQIFEDAERQMSAGLAREGAARAIECWDLREKAIRRAAALAHRK